MSPSFSRPPPPSLCSQALPTPSLQQCPDMAARAGPRNHPLLLSAWLAHDSSRTRTLMLPLMQAPSCLALAYLCCPWGKWGEHTTSAPILRLRGLPKGVPPRPGTPRWFSSPRPALPCWSELPPDPTVFQKPTVPARALVEVTLLLDGTCPDRAPASLLWEQGGECVDSGVPFPWSFLPQGCSLCVLPQRFQFAPLGSVEVAGGCRCWDGGGQSWGGRELTER